MENEKIIQIPLTALQRIVSHYQEIERSKILLQQRVVDMYAVLGLDLSQQWNLDLETGIVTKNKQAEQ